MQYGKKTGASCPCFLLFCDDAAHNLVHFRLGAGIVCLIKNLLLLVLRHCAISIQCRGIHCQCHTKPNRNLIKIHSFPPLRCCIQHIFDKNTVPHSWIIYQNMGYRTYQFPILNNGTAAHE